LIYCSGSFPATIAPLAFFDYLADVLVRESGIFGLWGRRFPNGHTYWMNVNNTQHAVAYCYGRSGQPLSQPQFSGKEEKFIISLTVSQHRREKRVSCHNALIPHRKSTICTLIKKMTCNLIFFRTFIRAKSKVWT
jgi:hypothetical protein